MRIVIRLSGGLGNQIFQLFAGWHAAQFQSSDEIFLDLRFLGKYETIRKFELDFISSHLSNVSILADFSFFPALASRMRFGKILDMTIGPYAFISSPNKLHYLNSSTLSCVVLDGYFQHPKLAPPAIVRLSLFNKLSQQYSYLRHKLTLLPNIAAVCVHIRRGDYVSSKSASSVFKAISLNYYRAAVRSFGADVKFLVFGDDPLTTSQFAKEVGGVDIATLGLALSEEFMLMALCDHHIIANSTFSWWASYLGYVPGKRVIAPKDWYIDANRSRLNPLLLPHFELISSD